MVIVLWTEVYVGGSLVTLIFGESIRKAFLWGISSSDFSFGNQVLCKPHGGCKFDTPSFGERRSHEYVDALGRNERVVFTEGNSVV